MMIDSMMHTATSVRYRKVDNLFGGEELVSGLGSRTTQPQLRATLDQHGGAVLIRRS
jgi:hypothetical protein